MPSTHSLLISSTQKNNLVRVSYEQGYEQVRLSSQAKCFREKIRWNATDFQMKSRQTPRQSHEPENFHGKRHHQNNTSSRQNHLTTQFPPPIHLIIRIKLPKHPSYCPPSTRSNTAPITPTSHLRSPLPKCISLPSPHDPASPLPLPQYSAPLSR
jgi:hypothetical protein